MQAIVAVDEYLLRLSNNRLALMAPLQVGRHRYLGKGQAGGMLAR